MQYRFGSVAVILLLHTLLTCHRIPALHLPESLLARTWNTVNLELFHTMARIGRALFWGGVSRLYSLRAAAYQLRLPVQAALTCLLLQSRAADMR